MESVLVANRGEIAVRVIRGVQEMGMRAIAVYSELDRDALHVQRADEAWNIGPPPAAESYLDIDKILEVAGSSGAALAGAGAGVGGAALGGGVDARGGGVVGGGVASARALAAAAFFRRKRSAPDSR